MSPIQNFVIGLVLATIGAAAFIQVASVDHAWRLVSIVAVGVVAAVAALIFFIYAARDADKL
jgi:heme/copper-type cytochrome/quinol oxidase subunit 4